MNTYMVQKIEFMKYPNDVTAIENAKTEICIGLNEVWRYCGGKLRRTNGSCYADRIGDIGYIATKIN